MFNDEMFNCSLPGEIIYRNIFEIYQKYESKDATLYFPTFFVLALTFLTSRLLIRGKYRVARDRVRLLVIWSENRINKMY